MFKKTLLAVTLAATSFVSAANWVGGVSYVNVSSDSDLDVSLGGIGGSIGYKFENEKNVTFQPEFRYAIGFSDDDVNDFGTRINIEMDSFISLSVRGQYNFENNAYVFAVPTYSNLEVTAKAGGSSASDDEWEFGFGAGAGYQFNEKTAIELTYESYDDTDVIVAGLKFNF